MQFRHPELLYALFLLLIPILVHLFQLRRFKKTEFTNVQFLKEAIVQTRKSSQIKKWLTLLTRLLALAALIIAFAQPFFANSALIDKPQETVIYLDNSFSLERKGSQGPLMKRAVQELLENIPAERPFTLFTNDEVFKKTTVAEVQNDLLQLDYSKNQLPLEAVVLKGKKEFSKQNDTQKNLLIISDFQNQKNPNAITSDTTVTTTLVPLKPENLSNIGIDSIYIAKSSAETMELKAVINTTNVDNGTIPVALYNGTQLIAKTSVAGNNDTTQEAVFSVNANEAIAGRVVVEDAQLKYDNTLFFSIHKNPKIRVLSINEADDIFLRRIYTQDEFEYTQSSFKQLNYSKISDQNVVVLNELKDIPNSLTTALRAFKKDGGIVIVIPNKDFNLDNYNNFLLQGGRFGFEAFQKTAKKITSISFDHPLYEDVFDKKIKNFQYPKVNGSISLSMPDVSPILSYEDHQAFLTQSDTQTYVFTAPLNTKDTNFQNAPLIVPTFYNIGRTSLDNPELYYTIGTSNSYDIDTTLGQDQLLQLAFEEQQIIPLQQSYGNKVSITTDETPYIAGVYSITKDRDTIHQVSYNYNRAESSINYLDLKQSNTASSVASFFETLKTSNSVKELWKWFVIFALGFLLIEMLILKFLK